MAAPITLALRTLPVAPRKLLVALMHSPPMRVLTHPLVTFAGFAISPFVLYYTPLYEATLLLAAASRVRLQRSTHRKHVDLLQGIVRVEPGRYPLLWLEYPEPVAYSIAGCGALQPVIIVSRALADRLPARDLAAVLEHERAHLRGRHHLLVGLAEALAVALPRLPLMRTSPVLVRTLVELAADRAAARIHSAATVRAALVAMGVAGTPGHSLAMGRDAVSVRLRWLEAANPTGRGRQMATAGLAGISAALAPAAIGAGALAVAGLMTCASLALN